jgi:hypothetical protein
MAGSNLLVGFKAVGSKEDSEVLRSEVVVSSLMLVGYKVVQGSIFSEVGHESRLLLGFDLVGPILLLETNLLVTTKSLN